MTGLPAYSGDYTRCPKCTGSLFGAKYLAPGLYGTPRGYGDTLLRECDATAGGCGYQWAEACLDAGTAAPAVPPPFSGRDTQCRKCGEDRITTAYAPPSGEKESAEAPGAVAGEHLDRRCKHCGYQWPELCADAAPTEEEP